MTKTLPKPKKRLSDKYRGILTKKQGEELNEHIKQMREECQTNERRMGTTNKNMIDNSLKESLLKLIELSKSKVVQNQTVTFEINLEVKDLLEVELKKDCSEYHFQIDIYAIKHIFKEHGDVKKEENRGQIAIQDNDILLLIDVLQEPDLIFNSGKNKLGKETVTFMKMIDDKYVVVQEVREGRKTIALNSMRIFKTKRTK